LNIPIQNRSKSSY